MVLSDTFLNYLTTAFIVLGALLIIFWISLIVWAYRDMRSRSRDVFAQVLSAFLVALLPGVGILIYLILRPAETLTESFEKALLEEALLQEIEKKPHCPGCSRNVQADWQVCPHCHVKLKQPCNQCNKLIELQWTICPFCAHVQSETNETSFTNEEDQLNTDETQQPWVISD